MIQKSCQAPVEVGSLFHYLQGFSYIPGGAVFFLHQQQVLGKNVFLVQTVCTIDFTTHPCDFITLTPGFFHVRLQHSKRIPKWQIASRYTDQKIKILNPKMDDLEDAVPFN